jgi:2-polyprenyl-3-methyl-5-hydroxy-6-metoxy-1,4-benzoquinol methylase
MSQECKICSAPDVKVVEHTATCRSCGVLLFFPYPSQKDLEDSYAREHAPAAYWEQWYSQSARLNHDNFTRMLRFACADLAFRDDPSILDYGGGGGQFAVVCKSHFPNAKVYIVDAVDGSLLPQWAPLQTQIPFSEFPADDTRFDRIFLNDVFEHVSDPKDTLVRLRNKLKPGGKIFIDTPKQFWLYPFTGLLAPSLHRKLLRGTVSLAHLQIWSRKSFEYVVRDAGFAITSYREISEYTQPASFYLKNMKVSNPGLILAARLFYRFSEYLAKNKIMAVLESNSP